MAEYGGRIGRHGVGIFLLEKPCVIGGMGSKAGPAAARHENVRITLID